MKNLSQKLVKFFSMSLSDKCRLIAIWLTLFFIWSLLQILPFNIFLKIYRKSLSFPFASPRNIPHDKTAYFTTKAASLFPFSITCLPIAMTYKWLLRDDKAVYLKIGVQQKQGFEFHAWVERFGEILINETQEDNFSLLWQV